MNDLRSLIKAGFRGKRICIWGYGVEGKSTESFLKKHCNPGKLDIYEGDQPGLHEEKYDVIIKSPGIKAEWYNEKYTSATEIFLSEFRSQTIGITGTKGKSTTSNLLFHVLSDCLEDRAILVGNIGIPCLDLYDEIDKDKIIVFELSCHQLAQSQISPHIAVFLNLYEEHLDYYGTFEDYFRAKRNITAHQTSDDHFFVGDNVPEIKTAAHTTVISPNDDLHFETPLKGKHNQFNAAFVYSICSGIYGIPDEEIRKSMKTFTGLRHRLEYLGKINGIDYYDDSISTIPEAAIAAAESIPNAGSFLIGGYDRNIDYGKLVSFIDEHPGYLYFFMYESGKRVYGQVIKRDNCFCCGDLNEAVSLAKNHTPAGKACILSPAAASYGHFKNFEERGDCFRKLVEGEQSI